MSVYGVVPPPLRFGVTSFKVFHPDFYVHVR
jgi:hypothetical protein